MEKLIELLNEYEKDGLNEFETYVERWYCERTYQILSGKWENSNELKPCEIISKRYGFIKWLVETQKIDTFKLSEARFDTMKIYEWTNYKTVNDGNTDRLVMLLSIQEKPVELLIDLLK